MDRAGKLSFAEKPTLTGELVLLRPVEGADAAGLFDLVEKLAETNVLGRGALSRILEQHHQSNDQKENNHPEREIPEIRVHSHPTAACRSPTPRGGSSCCKQPFKRTRLNCQEKRICLNLP